MAQCGTTWPHVALRGPMGSYIVPIVLCYSMWSYESYVILSGPLWSYGSYALLLGPMWSYVVLYSPMWSHVVPCRPMWSYVMVCDSMWCYVGLRGAVRISVVVCGPIWCYVVLCSLMCSCKRNSLMVSSCPFKVYPQAYHFVIKNVAIYIAVFLKRFWGPEMFWKRFT